MHVIHIEWISSEQNRCDVFMKNLPLYAFNKHAGVFNGDIKIANPGIYFSFRQTLMTTYCLYSAIGYMGNEVADIFTKIVIFAPKKMFNNKILRLQNVENRYFPCTFHNGEKLL